MKIFVFLFLILFYKGLYYQESINNHIEIIGNWYVNTYGFKEEMQKFKILKLFDNLEGKEFKIKIGENLETKGKEYAKKEKYELNWEMEIFQHPILMPQTPSKNIHAIDEGVNKFRDKVLRKSNVLVDGIKCIYKIEDKNIYEFCSFKCFHLNFKYVLFSTGENGVCKDDILKEDIRFKAAGIYSWQEYGSTIFERETIIYGIIK